MAILGIFGLGLMEMLILGVICMVPLIAGIVVFATSKSNASRTINPNLMPCPDCGIQISQRAAACPHCGCPLKGHSPE